MQSNAHLSFSQMNEFAQCPRSWFAKRIQGMKSPAGEAANFGNSFDQTIAQRLGLRPNDEKPKATGSILAPENNANLLEVNNAVDFYFLQPESWKKADETQSKIECTPEQWAVFVDEYDAYGEIDAPLIGFIDLVRKDKETLETHINDLKTSSMAGFKPDWLLQTGLYALIKRAKKIYIHLITRLKKGYGFHEYVYRPTDMTFQWILNWVGHQNEGMRKATLMSPSKLSKNSGFWCAWCPMNILCEGYMVSKIQSTRKE